MNKYAIVLYTVFAAALANEAIEPSEAAPGDVQNRLFFNNLITTRTSVVYTLTTTVAVSSITRVCASTSNVTGTCRRRRGIEEQPLLVALDDDIDMEQILPFKTVEIEASAAPQLPEDPVQQVVEAVPNKENIDPSEDGKFIADPSLGRQFYFVTVVATSTSTITSTSYVSATVSTKTYIVVGCTPSGFSTNLC